MFKVFFKAVLIWVASLSARSELKGFSWCGRLSRITVGMSEHFFHAYFYTYQRDNRII